MSGQSSKRRRVDPPSKQSKLHHFFLKPVGRTEELLSQVSSQKLRKDGLKNDRRLSKEKSSGLSSTQSYIKPSSFGQSDPGNIFSCEKESSFEKRSILRDIGNSSPYVKNSVDNKTSPRGDSLFSQNVSYFLNQSGERFETTPITNQPSSQADFLVNRDDSQLDELNTNDVMTITHSPIIGQIKHYPDLSEQSLNSHDVDTLPFSAVISKPSVVAHNTATDSKPSHFPVPDYPAIASRSNEETLEELNTIDAETVPFSFVIGKHLTETTPSKSSSAEERYDTPTMEDQDLAEMNTADVMTLPCSFVIGNGRKSVKTTPGNNTSEHTTKGFKAEKYKKVKAPERGPQSSIVSPQEEGPKSSIVSPQEDLSYMDRVWAMFESDSDEEPQVTTKVSADKLKVTENKDNLGPPINSSSVSQVTHSKYQQLSQLEELNTADVLTLPSSPIVGQMALETCPRGVGPEYSNSRDSYDTVCEEDSLVEEDSLTLDNFHGMRGPNSIFMGT